MRPWRAVSTLGACRERDQFVSSLPWFRAFQTPQVDHWQVGAAGCLLRCMDTALPPGLLRKPRFDQIAITSVFGNPRELRTWSGAPANVASALERQGLVVKEIQPRIGKIGKIGVALTDVLAGRGRPVSTEQVLRSLTTRRRLAAQVDEAARRLGVRNVMHTGTLDLLPGLGSRDIRHYLYCDHTWSLASQHHVHASHYTERAV